MHQFQEKRKFYRMIEVWQALQTIIKFHLQIQSLLPPPFTITFINQSIEYNRMDKKLALAEKGTLKMSLRDHSHIKPAKFIQYDEQEEEKHIENKSRRWWLRVNRKYFEQKNKQELQLLRNTIMEDIYLPNDAIPIKQQSYFSRNLLSKNSKLFERKSIKVLFHNNQTETGYGQTLFFSYYFRIKNQQCNQDSEQEQLKDAKQSIIDSQISIADIKVMRMKDKSEDQVSEWEVFQTEEQRQQTVESVDLVFNKSTVDTDFIIQCNYFDLTKECYYACELDRQIYLWQEQLRRVQTFNDETWTKIYQNLETEIQQQNYNEIFIKIKEGYNMDEDVTIIQEVLKWQHNLVNFKHGFGQKDEEMLAEALEGMWSKQNSQNNLGEKKKFFKQSLQNLMITKAELVGTFQTDCKICFSTYVSSKNQVIYCDRCNQSFHEQCYGIDNLNTDPQNKFYCDACQYEMDENNVCKTVPNCQICFVSFSPLKKIGDHFFHSSCLFLNNKLKSKLGQLQLRDGLTSDIILQQVKVECQQKCVTQCEYCTQTCKKGKRLKCSELNCEKHFHYICAYLNGAMFNIWRNNENLQIQIRCWEHFPERDHIRQIYLRRFFCNYKNVSALSQKQLIQIYREEAEAIQQYKQEMRQRENKMLRKQIRKDKQSQKIDNAMKLQISIVSLQSDENHQQKTISVSDSSTSSIKKIDSNKPRVQVSSQNGDFLIHRAESGNLNILVKQLKKDIEKISNQIESRSNEYKLSENENKSYQKISKYLQTVNINEMKRKRQKKIKMVLKESEKISQGTRQSHQCSTKGQNQFKEQIYCSQAELNTNSNDSQNHNFNSNRIILQ